MSPAGSTRLRAGLPRRLLSTTAFRMALGYTMLFAVSGMVLLGLVFWMTAGLAVRQTDATIAAEITGLGEQYRRTGIGGLRGIISERSRNQLTSVYLLIDPLGNPLAGNLDVWPAPNARPLPDGQGWFEFDFARPVGATTERHTARARQLQLRGGFQLLVGRDVQPQRNVAARVKRALVWAGGLTLALGLGGGLLMSRRLLRRIEAINATGRLVTGGDFSQRAPVGRSGDEIDEIASQLNTMLARIEELMAGMQYVSESIAHDLRSPLTRLRQGLENALATQEAQSDGAAAVGGAIEECEQLIATFNALLTIANLESGGPAELAPVALDEVALDAAELYRPAAEDGDLAFAVDVGPGFTVRGNKPLLNQAVANLLDNAIKYTPAGGSIAVSLTDTDDGPVLTVADSGPGIAAADRARVLERFVRLQQSRGHEGGEGTRAGSGLGLSLVQAVADLHGADLTLEDNHPGLRVVLRFPATALASKGAG